MCVTNVREPNFSVRNVCVGGCVCMCVCVCVCGLCVRDECTCVFVTGLSVNMVCDKFWVEHLFVANLYTRKCV